MTAAQMHRVALLTFGRLRVSAPGRQVEGLYVHRKPLALCVLLAVERNVTRERAVELLWGDSDKGRQSLSQALLQLRRDLGDDWIDVGRDELRVADDVWCDADFFETSLRNDNPVDGLNMYRGPFLGDFEVRAPSFEQWVDRRRARYALLLRDAIRQLIAAAVAEGNMFAALDRARYWVSVAAADDEAQHRLIELLAAAGRRSEALEHYELYRRALQLDDLTPLDETVALVEAIRRGDALGPLTTMVRGEPRPESPRTRRLGGRAPDGPRLIRIADGGVEAEAYPLSTGITRVGRSDGDITFAADALLEALHASFEVERPSSGGIPRIVLRDESSRAGVYLRVRGSWPLRHGDRFRVGQQQFRFENASQEPKP